jgi:hypothetical protein
MSRQSREQYLRGQQGLQVRAASLTNEQAANSLRDIKPETKWRAHFISMVRVGDDYYKHSGDFDIELSNEFLLMRVGDSVAKVPLFNVSNLEQVG